MEEKKNGRLPMERITNAYRCARLPRIPSDVEGWYTGIDEDGELPVQDADDL